MEQVAIKSKTIVYYESKTHMISLPWATEQILKSFYFHFTLKENNEILGVTNIS